MSSEIIALRDNRYTKSQTNINMNYMIVGKIPNRIKGMIMISLLDKYDKRGKTTLRQAFLKLYAKCQKNKKQKLFDRLLGGYSCKLSKQSFLYRIKYFARETQKKQQAQPQIKINLIQQRTVMKKDSNFTFYQNNQSFKYTSLNNFILPPNQENEICISDRIQQKQTVNEPYKLKVPKYQKSSKQHSFRSNTALQSLRSIIDDKVLKKKGKHSHVCFETGLEQNSAQQNFRNKNRKNTTSAGALIWSDRKLFGNEEKSQYSKLQNLMQQTLGKKDIKITDTLRLLKQIASAYLQKTLKHKFIKVKHQAFLKFKSNFNGDSGRQYNNQILQLQRQLQLLNENIEKDEEIELLTQQIQNHVQDIDCIEQEFESLSNKMKNQLLSLFVTKIQKILCRQVKQSLLLIKQAFYIEQKKQKILQQSFSNEQSIRCSSRKFAGLNSVQSLMQESQNSNNNFKIQDSIVEQQQKQPTYQPSKKSNKLQAKGPQKKISLRLQKLSYQLEECEQEISQINLKGQNHFENLDISLSGGDLLHEDAMKESEEYSESEENQQQIN